MLACKTWFVNLTAFGLLKFRPPLLCRFPSCSCTGGTEGHVGRYTNDGLLC